MNLQNTTKIDNIYKQLKMLNKEEKMFYIIDNIFLLQWKIKKEKLNKYKLEKYLDVQLKLKIKEFYEENKKIKNITSFIYDYFIGENTDKGEFFTPLSVCKILAKITVWKKKEIESVYDPTCWWGNLLTTFNSLIKTKYTYWQEYDEKTSKMCIMNLEDYETKVNIENWDTLEQPKHKNEKFEAIVANPPYSVKWNQEWKKEDYRFKDYSLAPKGTADYAFLLHSLKQLKENWTMAIVLPLWVLFRWSKEKEIRQELIENQYLDAVIWLPDSIFQSTKIPTVILVFKKNRKKPEEILFIDASNEFTKWKKTNELNEDNINKIVETYKDRKEVDKYSRNVKMGEIIENDYNLNIPRYIDTSEPEVIIDIDEVNKEIKEIDKEMEEVNKLIEKDCKELGISLPF